MVRLRQKIIEELNMGVLESPPTPVERGYADLWARRMRLVSESTHISLGGRTSVAATPTTAIAVVGAREESDSLPTLQFQAITAGKEHRRIEFQFE